MEPRTHQSYKHEPVMLKEVMTDLSLFEGATVVDVTAGGGGHLSHIARSVGSKGTVIGLDRDLRAHGLDAAGGVADEFSHVKLFHAPFSELKSILREQNISQIHGLLCDLGVSSVQLDQAERGFSFQKDGPIDMRMDTSRGMSAYEFITHTDEKTLADTIYEYGEERFSRRIAKVIKASWPLPDSTLALANLIAKAVGRRERIHPATRTFQALRIAVNEELGELKSLLKDLPDLLAPKGRAVIISFHSLEDRAVKHAFLDGSKRTETHLPYWTLLHKRPVQATDEEIKQNPRARSAKLRSVEKLDVKEII